MDAEKRISPYILKTPLIESRDLGELIGGKVYLKLESEQYTGSFKARGSLNKLLSLDENEKEKGVITDAEIQNQFNPVEASSKGKSAESELQTGEHQSSDVNNESEQTVSGSEGIGIIGPGATEEETELQVDNPSTDARPSD